MQPQTDIGSTASTTTFKLAIVILIKENKTPDGRYAAVAQNRSSKKSDAR
ncbi:hypothetical protein [Coleofasciculus sp. H7-2]